MDVDDDITPEEYMEMSRTMRNAARLSRLLEELTMALDRGDVDDGLVRRLEDEQQYWPETAGCEGDA